MYHSLGLKSDGSIVAWGLNDKGQCDVPEPNSDFVAVAAGIYHSLALKSDGSIVAWGDNSSNQCDVPVPNSDFVAVAAGYRHSLGLKSDGSIEAWGNNDSNQCDVPADTGFVAVAAGAYHSLALNSSGSIIAWGDNSQGQCNVPGPNTGFVAVAAGAYHSLGLKPDGSIVAFGMNGSGQCTVPAPNTGFVAVAAGQSHSLGLKGDLAPLMFGNVNGKSIRLKTANVGGVAATFGLTGAGYGKIKGRKNFGQIELYGTTIESVLTITTKAKTEISVGNIISDGPLKTITARTTDLRGSITIDGSLASLTLDDVADDHTITIGSTSDPNAFTIMKFDEVSDLTIDCRMPIKTLTATNWDGGAVSTTSLGSITTTGSKKLSIPGDLNVDVNLPGSSAKTVKVAGTLSGRWSCDSIKNITAANIEEFSLTLAQEPNVRILALGSLTAKEWISYSRITSSGNIGKVTAGAINDSTCFVGVIITSDLNADDVFDLPDPAVDIDYTDLPVIKNVNVKGIKGEPECVINSNFAAARILNAFLAYPQVDNGDVAFGLASGYIKSLKIKDEDGVHPFKNLDEAADSFTFKEADDDMQIRLH